MIHRAFQRVFETLFGELTLFLSQRLSERCFAPAEFLTLHPWKGAAERRRGARERLQSIPQLAELRCTSQRRGALLESGRILWR